MYAVVKYFNYRKEMTLELLCACEKYTVAKKKAKGYAKNEFGEKMVKGVEDQYLYTNAIVEYTKGDGYESNVYAVMEFRNELVCSDVEEEKVEKELGEGKVGCEMRKENKERHQMYCEMEEKKEVVQKEMEEFEKRERGDIQERVEAVDRVMEAAKELVMFCEKNKLMDEKMMRFKESVIKKVREMIKEADENKYRWEKCEWYKNKWEKIGREVESK